MLKSLDNSKDALRDFAFQKDVEIKYKHQLVKHEWWARISDLLEILHLIHELQVMLESNRANISQVYPHWLQIELHLTAIANSPNYFALDIQEYLNEVGTEKIGNRTVEKKGWTRRKRRQLTPIHLAAYFLHPENYHVELTPNQLSQMRKHFNRFTSDRGKALEQFLDFRSQQSHFSETKAP